MKMLKYNFEIGKNIGIFSKYTQLQVDSIENIVCECNNQGMTKEQTAYILGTAYYEAYDYDGKTTGTIQRLVPLKEKGGQTYLKAKKYYPYIGYGFVQLTWLENYKKMQPFIKQRFGVDILSNPDLLLRVDIASFVIVYGMKNAMFSKYKLDYFINEGKKDYKGARRTVNGVDKADLIASYALQFLKCIK